MREKWKPAKIPCTWKGEDKPDPYLFGPIDHRKIIQHIVVTVAFYFNWANIVSTVVVNSIILMILGGIVAVLFMLSFWGLVTRQKWTANLIIALALFDMAGEFVAQGRMGTWLPYPSLLPHCFLYWLWPITAKSRFRRREDRSIHPDGRSFIGCARWIRDSQLDGCGTAGEGKIICESLPHGAKVIGVFLRRVMTFDRWQPVSKWVDWNWTSSIRTEFNVIGFEIIIRNWIELRQLEVGVFTE